MKTPRFAQAIKNGDVTMKSNMRRKEAVNEFKMRKTPRGVFAVRCTATGLAWVNSSMNLDAARNGIWFFLRNGYHQNKELQAEWDAHGATAFQFEVLEKLDEDVSSLALSDLLKEKKRYWTAQLGGRTL
ncbi:MAG: GIY-YIG nuclease family protein [Bryobacteraceae bacterium]